MDRLLSTPADLTDQQIADYLCMCNAGFIPPRSVMLEAARRLGASAQAATDRPTPPVEPPETPNAPAAVVASETVTERARRLNRERVARCRNAKKQARGNGACNGRDHYSITNVMGGKGGVSASVPPEAKAETNGEEEEKTETHPPSSPPREHYVGNAVMVPPTITTITDPAVPAYWGFDEWWSAWVKTAERLNDARVGSRGNALAAWILRKHCLNPRHPLACLLSWSGKKEWADRGKLPNPERFLSDDKYTPPVKAAWKPSAALQQLPDEQWHSAVIDATADLQRRGMLSPDRAATLDKAADDRSLLRDRFWHDLIGETPTFKAWVLYGKGVPA